ncbi:unnamed protein product [Allacma fusca]|uniref:Uncharacterized protein n=1 Tax=Allacma fusca TaxID=39272 RepID=A0A8J2M7R4_9HEXA|nr:unnamed protein product [Allacma fusca]
MLEILMDAHPPNPREVLVTRANIDSLRWNNYEDVIISSILTPIPEEKFLRSRETLTKLSFWDSMVLCNLNTCLNYLPNLRSLSFLNINIDESTNINENVVYQEAIQVTNLKSLSIVTDPRLRKDDYFLMDFFTRGVISENLENFEFRGEDNYNFYTIQLVPDNEDPNPSPTNIDRSILAQFLLKNRQSLKSLDIRGPGALLFDALTEELQDLPSVQVENMSIVRNVSSLTSIQIFPNILYDELSENLLMLTSIDCRCFEQCVNLVNLQLNLELMNRRKEWDSTKAGRVSNIASLPASLRQFNIISERILDTEMEALADRLAQFDQLEYMCLESTSPNTFIVKLEWIRQLYELPRIKRFLFNRAIIDDVHGAVDLIGQRPDARGSMVNDADLSIFSKLG